MIPFLERNFPGCRFDRMTPVKMKPGPRPNLPRKWAYGQTGSGLAEQMEFQLTHALKRPPGCAALLVIDDLDCHDAARRSELFHGVFEKFGSLAGIRRIIGFAAPELEAWLIADWDGTIAGDIDFRGQHAPMRWRLAATNRVPFDAPESFGTFDPARNACDRKLSDLIIESSQHEQGMCRFSKATHTPRLLAALRVDIVAEKCPHFREFVIALHQSCQTDAGG